MAVRIKGIKPRDTAGPHTTTTGAAMMQPRQNVPGEVKVEKEIAKIKFNADAMTLNDPVQRKSQMHAIFLSSKVVYFEVP
jgi:hypothetical protein